MANKCCCERDGGERLSFTATDLETDPDGRRSGHAARIGDTTVSARKLLESAGVCPMKR